MDHTTHTSDTSVRIYSNPGFKCTYFVEIRYLCNIDEIYHSKVLDFLGNAVERLIHRHALAIPIVTKAQDNNTVFFRFDGLVDVPTRRKMGKEIRHGLWCLRALVAVVGASSSICTSDPTASSLRMSSSTRPVVFMDINIGETP